MLKYIDVEDRLIQRPELHVIFDTNPFSGASLAARALLAHDPRLILPPGGSFWARAQPGFGQGFVSHLAADLLKPEVWEANAVGVRRPPTEKEAGTPGLTGTWMDVFTIARATTPEAMLTFSPQHVASHGISKVLEEIGELDAHDSGWPIDAYEADPASFYFSERVGTTKADLARLAFGRLILTMRYPAIMGGNLFNVSPTDAGATKDDQRYATVLERSQRAVVLIRWAFMMAGIAQLRVLLRLLANEPWQYALRLTKHPDDLALFAERAKRILALPLHPLVHLIERFSVTVPRETRFATSNPTSGVPREWLDAFLPGMGTNAAAIAATTTERQRFDADMLYAWAWSHLKFLERDLDDLEERGRLGLVQSILGCTSGPSPAQIGLHGASLEPVFCDGVYTTKPVSDLTQSVFGMHASHKNPENAVTREPWIGEPDIVETVPYAYWNERSGGRGATGPFNGLKKPLSLTGRGMAILVEPDEPEYHKAYTSLRLDPSQIGVIGHPLWNERFRGGLETEVFPATIEGVSSFLQVGVDELVKRVREAPGDWEHMFEVTPTTPPGITAKGAGQWAFVGPTTRKPWQRIVELRSGGTPQLQLAFRRGLVMGGGPCRAFWLRDDRDEKPSYPVEGALKPLLSIILTP